MNRYIFGLSNELTRSWIEKEWQKYGKKDLDGFVDEILLNRVEYILPLISGNEDTKNLLKRRFYEKIKLVMTEKEIREALKLEMSLIIEND